VYCAAALPNPTFPFFCVEYCIILETVSNGASGTALIAMPDDGSIRNVDYAINSSSPRLDYRVEFTTTGTHYVWVRGRGANAGSDSLHVGLDNIGLISASAIGNFFPHGEWAWSNTAEGTNEVRTIEVGSVGVHTVNVWMRESGMVLDKIVLTTDPDYRPSETGSAPSLWPDASGWPAALPSEVGLDATKLEQARDFALTAGGSGMITRHGKVVMSWGNPQEKYTLYSTSKSIGVSLLGLAMKDGLATPDDLAYRHMADFGVPPEGNLSNGWLNQITLRQLASHTAGFDKPGDFIALLHAPGTFWSYSDGGANWLADVLTTLFGADLYTILQSRVLSPLGIPSEQFEWRENIYRGATLNGVLRREFGSGINASVDAMARLGYLYLRRGIWRGAQILPQAFIDDVGRTAVSVQGLPVSDPRNFPNATAHYGLLWWNNADRALAGVPADAFWSWGLDESLIVVIPSLDIVVARAGNAGFNSGWNGDYNVLKPFLEPIAQAVTTKP
jgi:CubicO group peptidase (beta-lactamase class C family)